MSNEAEEFTVSNMNGIVSPFFHADTRACISNHKSTGLLKKRMKYCVTDQVKLTNICFCSFKGKNYYIGLKGTNWTRVPILVPIILFSIVIARIFNNYEQEHIIEGKG